MERAVTRFLLTIQYLGTRYSGWQSQTNARGVQDEIQDALSTMCQRPVTIHGAGRTDTGVHARGQRAHVDLSIDIEPLGLVKGLNTMLPDDIRITDASIVPEDFHARYHARGKVYTYRIWNHQLADAFHSPTHGWIKVPLDSDRMRDAAGLLVGHHDFRAFTVTRLGVRTTTRTIHSITVDRTGNAIEITISGNGFLRYMVRRIVGVLIEVGAGRLEAGQTSSFLEPKFEEVRWTAPAQGLTLEKVSYDGISRTN